MVFPDLKIMKNEQNGSNVLEEDPPLPPDVTQDSYYRNIPNLELLGDFETTKSRTKPRAPVVRGYGVRISLENRTSQERLAAFFLQIYTEQQLKQRWGSLPKTKSMVKNKYDHLEFLHDREQPCPIPYDTFSYPWIKNNGDREILEALLVEALPIDFQTHDLDIIATDRGIAERNGKIEDKHLNIAKLEEEISQLRQIEKEIFLSMSDTMLRASRTATVAYLTNQDDHQRITRISRDLSKNPETNLLRSMKYYVEYALYHAHYLRLKENDREIFVQNLRRGTIPQETKRDVQRRLNEIVESLKPLVFKLTSDEGDKVPIYDVGDQYPNNSGFRRINGERVSVIFDTSHSGLIAKGHYIFSFARTISTTLTKIERETEIEIVREALEKSNQDPRFKEHEKYLPGFDIERAHVVYDIAAMFQQIRLEGKNAINFFNEEGAGVESSVPYSNPLIPWPTNGSHSIALPYGAYYDPMISNRHARKNLYNRLNLIIEDLKTDDTLRSHFTVARNKLYENDLITGKKLEV